MKTFFIMLTLSACATADEVVVDEGEAVSAEIQGQCANNPSNANCTGKDPIRQGCNDAVPVHSTDIVAPVGYPGGTATLRYSRKCKSVWTRTAGIIPASRDKYALIQARGYAYQTFDTSANSVNSRMIFIGNSGYASYEGCGFWSGSEGGYGWHCGTEFDVPVP